MTLKRLRKWLREAFPAAYQYAGIQKARLRSRKGLAQVFSEIYERNEWGDAASASGRGSNLDATARIRERLPSLVEELGVQTMLDAPCGDFHWMKEVPLAVRAYVGADIVRAIIERNEAIYGNERLRFIVLDITREPGPPVDLIFCRDCLVHLSYQQVFAALRNFKASGSTWLLTTTYPECDANRDIPAGAWRRLNLQRAPFFFPQPSAVIHEAAGGNEGRYPDKSLGLWRLDNIEI